MPPPVATTVTAPCQLATHLATVHPLGPAASGRTGSSTQSGAAADGQIGPGPHLFLITMFSTLTQLHEGGNNDIEMVRLVQLFEPLPVDASTPYFGQDGLIVDPITVSPSTAYYEASSS
jgi:hypothetical protein